ncbi:P-loop containing nucleoside triphosphate hydrolase protein [Fomitopsis betulina]|nr:P-loop containing nucleoside triphosphate hydrolase protein [Fomitopsis betulina]
MWRVDISRCYHTHSFYRLARALRTQPRFDYSPPEDGGGAPYWAKPAGLATPRQLVRYLDEFVVGQERAKKVLSVAVFNHYNRVHANVTMQNPAQNSSWLDQEEEDCEHMLATTFVAVTPANVQPHPNRLRLQSIPPLRPPLPLFEKSNVLVIGPTGSGKTLLARTLATVLDVPFSVSDATSFTQSFADVGEDADMCIQRLLQGADWDPYRASIGIVYIDEIDKVARKVGSGGLEGSRDVGGEGVQQALLRMMEGSMVTVQTKAPAAASGSDGRRAGQRSPGTTGPRPDTCTIDTSNVLFILSGAFVGLDSIIKRRVQKGSIGFTAPLASPSEPRGSSHMPFFTPNSEAVPNVLDQVEPEAHSHSFIPEFIARMPSVTTLSPLSISDLRKILTDVRGSLVSQYTALFGYSGIEIKFTSKALDEICHKAFQRGGGARGLRGIMESLLLEPMYEAPYAIRHVLINGAVIRGEEQPQYWTKGEAHAFWAAWAAEEEQYSGAS